MASTKFSCRIVAAISSGWPHRSFALELPAPGASADAVEVRSLGRHPVFVTSFGRDPQGRVYLADFARGDVMRIGAPHP